MSIKKQVRFSVLAVIGAISHNVYASTPIEKPYVMAKTPSNHMGSGISGSRLALLDEVKGFLHKIKVGDVDAAYSLAQLLGCKYHSSYSRGDINFIAKDRKCKSARDYLIMAIEGGNIQAQIVFAYTPLTGRFGQQRLKVDAAKAEVLTNLKNIINKLEDGNVARAEVQEEYEFLLEKDAVDLLETYYEG